MGLLFTIKVEEEGERRKSRRKSRSTRHESFFTQVYVFVFVWGEKKVVWLVMPPGGGGWEEQYFRTH